MNSLSVTMIRKGNYYLTVWAPERMTFIAVDSNEGYWTAFNSLGVSVLREKTKQDLVNILNNATIEDLNLFNNQEQV